jgi:predicted site-specific integrase-resolvase
MLNQLKAEIPPVLIQREAAQRLGVTRQTLTNWRRAGFGPCPIRVGGSLVYDPVAVDAFAAGVR